MNSQGERFDNHQAEEDVNRSKGDEGQDSHLCSSENSEFMPTCHRNQRVNRSHIQNYGSTKGLLMQKNNALSDIYGNSTLKPDQDGSVPASKLESDASIFFSLVMKGNQNILARPGKIKQKLIKELKSFDTYLHRHTKSQRLEVSRMQ